MGEIKLPYPLLRKHINCKRALCQRASARTICCFGGTIQY